MIQFALLQLILYNCVQNHIKWVIILNCWDLKTQLYSTEMMMGKNLYVQLRDINYLDLKGDFEERYLKHDHTQVGVFFDFNCKKSSEVLKKASQEKLFKQNFLWLIHDKQSNLAKFRELFENFHMAVDAEVTYAIPNQRLVNAAENSSYLTYDVYNNGYNLGGKLNMTEDREILCFRKDCLIKRNLSSLHENGKFANRWSMRDITMRVTTVVTYLPLTEPKEKLLAYLESKENWHQDGVARFGFEYLMILRDSLECNLSYNFTNTWSRTESTGGCVGALGVDNAADLSSSPFLPSLTRFSHVHPTMPLGNFRQVCIFRTPRNADIRSGVYLEPFAYKTWLLFICMLLLIGVLLWLIFFLENRQLKLYLKFIPSVLTACLISFGSACCQGSFIVPFSMGGRITFFSLSLLTYIIYNYYTSIVVAILLGSPVKSHIKTMDQLASSNLEVALEPIPFANAYFNFSTLPKIRSFVSNKITSRKNPESVWLPIEEGLRRVRDEPGFVYGTEAFSGYDLIERTYDAQEICDLNEVLIRPLQVLHTHLPKNSSYWEIIRLKQVRILESGIHQRLQRTWVRNRLHCDMTNSYVIQVGLEYTAPLFIMLAVSYLLVILVLMGEILWYKIVQDF